MVQRFKFAAVLGFLAKHTPPSAASTHGRIETEEQAFIYFVGKKNPTFSLLFCWVVGDLTEEGPANIYKIYVCLSMKCLEIITLHELLFT